MRVETIAGRKPVGTPIATSVKPCDRCGLETTRNCSRKRKDGLRLCRDCGSDKWLIERYAAK